ncbi:MAG: hypothetical protein ACRDNH_10035 [Gaiellaceae bacterium]
MTTRILGPTASRRRRRFLLAPIFLLTVVALFMAAGAQAVHDIGVFQLDKDATTLENPAVSGEDWDLICKAHQPSSTPPGTCVFAPDYDIPVGDTTASPSSFVVDPSESAEDDILKGGTKDDNDIDSWKWASAKPSPPKNDITDGYAAEYVCDNDDVGTDNCTGTDGDKILYFGADRFSNNGSANIAFWFLQNDVTKAGADPDGTCGAGAGCPFDGLHTAGNVSLGGSEGTGCNPNNNPDNICTPGDILIISAFGPKAAINIYEWVGDGNATNPPGPGGCFTSDCSLEPLSVGGQACEDVDNDNACATVNDVVTPSPWLLNQSNGPPNSFQPTNFFEGGLNLTQLGVDACFSTFVINTRSSAAGDAELHDLILGQFSRCEADLTTLASTTGTVTPGTEVHDTATVTVGGATNPDDPTGTVTFSLCGPNATKTACTTGGVSAGTGLLGDSDRDGVVDDANPTDGTAIALSADVNTDANPLDPGFYCFRADWPGDSNYPGALSFTNNTDECFEVADTTTTATEQNWTPNDSATITSAGDSDLDGTVRFQLYDDGACGADGGTVVYQEDVDVPAGTASPHEVETSNGDGVPATGDASDEVFDVTDSPVDVSWRVTFTSDDAGVGGSTANCETSTGLTIDDDNEPSPPPPPPAPAG